jgi:hypothetical protein
MPIIGGRANASRGYFGGGIRPFSPVITSSTEGSQTLTIAFTAPLFNGGLAITSYEYAVRPFSGAWTAWETASFESTPLQSPIVISGLVNGTSYTVAIRAVNGLGPSASSNQLSTSTTPRTVPNAPEITSITRGYRQLIINFNAPAFNGGSTITNYEYSLDNGANFISMSKAVATPQTVTGLEDNTEYNVKVRAINVAGNGVQSTTTSQTTAGVPFAPTSGVAVPRQSLSSTTSWALPDNNASPISDYIIQRSTSSTFASDIVTFNDGVSTSRTVNVTSLNAGTVYYFRVAAVNQVGQGPFSSIFSARTAITGPSTPSVSLSGTTVSLDWAPGAGQSGFRVYRRVSNGSYALIATVTNSDTTDAIPAYQTTYEYGVSSIFNFGTGIEETAILDLGSARAEVGAPTNTLPTIVTNWTASSTDTIPAAYGRDWDGNKIKFNRQCSVVSGVTGYQVSINDAAFVNSERSVDFEANQDETYKIKWRAYITYTYAGATQTYYSAESGVRTVKSGKPFKRPTTTVTQTFETTGVFRNISPNGHFVNYWGGYATYVVSYQWREVDAVGSTLLANNTRRVDFNRPQGAIEIPYGGGPESGTGDDGGNYATSVFTNYHQPTTENPTQANDGFYGMSVLDKGTTKLWGNFPGQPYVTFRLRVISRPMTQAAVAPEIT